MGWVAAQTDYIHLATGINSLSPRKEHPARFAERAAMLDHFTDRRFEWGTGRGAGSHEMATFNILDKNSTKAEWDEVVREIPRMWEQLDYKYQGDSFTVPYPHNILPKPYGKGHPPIWVACGNPRHVHRRRRARHRRHRLQLRADLQPAGPHRRLQGGRRQLHRADRPVQERQRDDHQLRHLLRDDARRPARSPSVAAAATS